MKKNTPPTSQNKEKDEYKGSGKSLSKKQIKEMAVYFKKHAYPIFQKLAKE